MNFLKRFTSAAGATVNAGEASVSTASSVASSPVAVYYSLSSFRWHMDTRPPVKAILVHDLFSSGQAWKQSIHEYIGSMPMKQLTPTDPLEIYCPDLRGHGFSDALQLEGCSYVETAIQDVVALQQQIVVQKCCLGGVGFGALLACQAAIEHPQQFTSLSFFVQDITSFLHCHSGQYSYRNLLSKLNGVEESLGVLNTQLSHEITRPDERALLLANTKKESATPERSTIKFRVHPQLLERTEPYQSAGLLGGGPVVPLPTNVFHVATLKDSDKAAFQKRFPRAVFSQLKTADDIYPGSPKLAGLVLHAFDVLGKMNTDG